MTRLAALARDLDVDVLVAVSPENFAYVSGAWIYTTRTLPPRQAFAVLARHAEPSVLVCSIERIHAVEESWIQDVRTYTEFAEHPMDALAALLKQRGLDHGRLGIDLEFLPYASYVRLAAQLPGMTIVDTTQAVAARRAIKSPDEIARIESVTRLTHRAGLRAMAEARLGESEKTMCARLLNGVISDGADGIVFVVFGSGPNSGKAHALPTERVPRESEIIRWDYGGTFGPWMSDFSRTFSTGKPTEEQRSTYRRLREVQAETIGAIRPGIAAEELFLTCRAGFERRGMRFFMPHIGHSFGLELHEAPMLRPGNRTLLQPGMTLNVEPIALDADGSGYQLEDLVLVTDNGHRLLTDGLAPEEIPVIGR